LPAYERQVLAQVQASITGPHAKEVHALTNSFRVELVALQRSVSTAEQTGVDLK